jgi:hypothetical protein
MTKQSVASDLRAQLVDIEGRQVELLAERDEISYSAVVARDKEAIERLAALNAELGNLKNQSASLEAALREATKREIAAAEAERNAKRKQNAAAAAEILLHVEETAAQITKDMAGLRSRSIELQRQFADIRALIGVGATDQQLRVFLTRCVKTALMGTSAQIEHLAPNERTDVNAVIAPWATSIRNFMNTAVGEKPAKEAA